MKVLHIWNTAGVASLLASTQREHGHEVSVLMRASHDPFNFTSYYGDKPLNVGGALFITEVIKQAANYDVIHVHALYKILKELREAYPLKKIILQHHGTELTTANFYEVSKSYTYCDSIISSTIDIYELLHKYGVKSWYIPNAVDTKLFKPSGNGVGALYISTRYLNQDAALNFIGAIPYDIYTIDREKAPTTIDQMPELLNQFELYIDVKFLEPVNTKPIQAMSKTGLEALACGLKVLNYNGDIIEGLPTEHTPEQQYIDTLTVYHS